MDPIFIWNGKKGKESKTDERPREREGVRAWGWLQEEVASIVKMTFEDSGPFGIRIGLRR